jgi:hypothetical protein
MASPTFVTENLDRIEAALPPVPARVLRLQRAIAGTLCDRLGAVTGAMTDSTKNFVETARLSGKTVTGQTRAAGADVLGTATTGARQVADQAQAAGTRVAKSARTGARVVSGQANAQGRRLSATAQRETTDLLDSAIDAVEDADEVDDTPGSGRPYEQWTKAELLERARQLDIEGRSGLSKKELIEALRAA